MVSPWREFDHTFRALESLQRRLDDALGTWGPSGVAPVPVVTRARVPWPRVNAFETKDAFVYKAYVPGLSEGDVSVFVEDQTLVLRGERKSQVPEGFTPHLRERSSVAFARSLPLAGRVDAEGVAATLKEGVLTVTLPKAKDTLPRQIAVKSA